MPESKLAHSVWMGAVAMWFKDSTWWEKVDPDTFDIQKIHRCIVGQYFREKYNWLAYENGLRDMGIAFEEAHKFGFDAHSGEYYDHEIAFDDPEYWEKFEYRKRVLNRMWAYVIRAEEKRFAERVLELERKACMRRHPSYKGD